MPPPDVGVVVALAGRRIDPPAADPRRFPLAEVRPVHVRLGALLRERRARMLVSSAACGADLLALRAAEELGVPGRIILPFAPERFRESSVTDRPGDWGGEFDHQIARARAAGNLVVLEEAGEGAAAYAAANAAILAEAEALARELGVPPVAVIVWDGHPRGPDDLTASLAASARSLGWEVVEVAVGGRTDERVKG